MSISSRVCLCLVFLTFFTSSLVLCSRSPRMTEASSAMAKKKLERQQARSPTLLVSGSPKADDDSSSSSMTNIDDDSAKNSAIAGFFKFPLPGWHFHKYGPYPMVKPADPSVHATPSARANEEETEKVPSSPNNGNGNGGNA
ncbi:unnamed protein product [Cochlearia groenlandica]